MAVSVRSMIQAIVVGTVFLWISNTTATFYSRGTFFACSVFLHFFVFSDSLYIVRPQRPPPQSSSILDHFATESPRTRSSCTTRPASTCVQFLIHYTATLTTVFPVFCSLWGTPTRRSLLTNPNPLPSSSYKVPATRTSHERSRFAPPWCSFWPDDGKLYPIPQGQLQLRVGSPVEGDNTFIVL